MGRIFSALILVMIMAVAPLMPIASAHQSIGLSTDVSHIILAPGEATNLTLTIDNNGSAIETYSISVSGFDNVWEITPSEENVSNVIPTLSASTTIAVRLTTEALPSNSGTLTITVTEPDANISSEILVSLSVIPRYMPAIDATAAGDNGLVQMNPGESLNLTTIVTNNGNVNDTILLSVDQSPDFSGFWANWTSGGSSNNTGGNGGNNTTGNSTNGNNSNGNNTGGNSTGGNGSGDGTLSRTSTTDWEVRFYDDILEVMLPGESRSATLVVSIPTDTRPGFYGFDLYAASAQGNFSIQTMMVVSVTAIHNLGISHTNIDELLPGENATTTIEMTSLSNADGNWTWSISTVSGDCYGQLSELETEILEDDIYEVDVLVTAGINTRVNDECDLRLQGTLQEDTSVTKDYNFTVTVGQQWGLSMVIPTSIKLDVNTQENFNIAISNDGTEEDTISLTGIDSEGIIFTNPEPVTLSRGASQYVVMGVIVDSSLVGDITLNFTISSTNSGTESVNQSGIFEVKEFSSLSMTGPSDNRIIISPGDNASISLNISNQGTKDLELSALISGLPSGISVVSGLSDVNLSAGESLDIELKLSASLGIQPGSTPFIIKFDGLYSDVQLEIELQIIDRNDLTIDSSEDRIIASPANDSKISVIVTNLGTSQETFVAVINSSEVSNYFSISVDKLSLQLDPGESGAIEISAREIAVGAPSGGIDLDVTVTSTTDSSVTELLTISVVPSIADGLITVLSDDDTARPGETISGNVILTNLGTAVDTFTIDAVELNCTISQNDVILPPSMSSSPIQWSCEIPENERARTSVLTFRLTSATRSDMVVTFSELYSILPTWGDRVVSFSFENTDLIFDESNEQQTIPLEICNLANTQITGSLVLYGKNEPQFDGVFYRAGETGINNTYELDSNECQDFKLMLQPSILDRFEARIFIQSVSEIQGENETDLSNVIRVNVGGPELPPDGIDLGIFELNNQNSIIVLLTGWALSVLLVCYIKLFKKPPVVIEEEEEEEQIPLGPNEVRIDEYNKVSCTECEARLGVPEGSEPPFRFTCPQCDARIRVVE